VLKPTGHLYVLEPDRWSFRGFYALMDYFFRLSDPGHVRCYTVTELLSLTRRAGFVGGSVLQRYQRFLSGGKRLATASVLGARASSA